MVALPRALARPADDADPDDYVEWLRELLYPDRVALLDGARVAGVGCIGPGVWGAGTLGGAFPGDRC